MSKRLESKAVLMQSANERLRDAKVLDKRENKRYTGAVYLGGYVLECLLKAAICTVQGTVRLPAKYLTHELNELLDATGYRSTLPREIARKFADVTFWNVRLRYQGKRYNADEARRFLKNIEEIRQWILEKMAPR